MENSLKFYRELDFTESIFDFSGYANSLAIWFPEPQKMRVFMLANYYGAWIEPVEHSPPSKDLRDMREHLGPMDFAIGVTNLEKTYEELQKKA